MILSLPFLPFSENCQHLGISVSGFISISYSLFRYRMSWRYLHVLVLFLFCWHIRFFSQERVLSFPNPFLKTALKTKYLGYIVTCVTVFCRDVCSFQAYSFCPKLQASTATPLIMPPLPLDDGGLSMNIVATSPHTNGTKIVIFVKSHCHMFLSLVFFEKILRT